MTKVTGFGLCWINQCVLWSVPHVPHRRLKSTYSAFAVWWFSVVTQADELVWAFASKTFLSSWGPLSHVSTPNNTNIDCPNHSLAVKIWEQLFFTALAPKDTTNYFTACGLEPVSVSVTPAPHPKEYLQLRGTPLRMLPGSPSATLCIGFRSETLRLSLPRCWASPTQDAQVRLGGGGGFPQWSRCHLEVSVCESGVSQLFFFIPKSMRNVPSHPRNNN